MSDEFALHAHLDITDAMKNKNCAPCLCQETSVCKIATLNNQQQGGAREAPGITTSWEEALNSHDEECML